MLRPAKKEDLVKENNPDKYYFYKFHVNTTHDRPPDGRCVINIKDDTVGLTYIYQDTKQIRRSFQPIKSAYTLFSPKFEIDKHHQVFIGTKEDLAVFLLTKEFPIHEEDQVK